MRRWLAVMMAGVVWGVGGCGGDSAPVAPGSDAGNTGSRLCSRPAEGCPCDEGSNPVRCYEEEGSGDERVCHVGQMYCRGGQWSGCESIREFNPDPGGIGGASEALITGPSACSGCSPDCAQASDQPDATDLTADNSEDVVYNEDEGGVTLEYRRPPSFPSCSEEQMGLPPGGSYEEFCSESGSLFFIAEEPDGSQVSICSEELAARTFQNALCACEDIDGSYSFTTSSINSTGAPTDGLNGHVRTNGHYRLSAQADIGGEVTGYGTTLHEPGGQTNIHRLMEMNGPFSCNRQLEVGIATGDAYINGDVNLRATTIQGGAGALHLPAGANLMTAQPQSYSVVREPVEVDRPCRCRASEVVDIAAFVASTRDRNDNDVIGLDPDALNGYSSGTHVTLPCGRFYLTEVTGSSSLTITAEGRTALFIDGDLQTGSSLDINLANDDAEVDVFVAGKIEAGAAVRFGDEAAPARTRLYVGTTDAMSFSGNSRFYGNFYAPRSVVSFGGSIEVRGSLFVRKLSGTSNLSIVYDEAVQEVDCPPREGRYWREYDAPEFCGGDTEVRPDWGTFSWDVDVPEGSLIAFQIRTAETAAELDSATPVTFEVPPSGPPANVGDLLVAAGEMNFLPYLRVTAVLRSDGIDAPLLRSFDLEFECGLGTSGMSDPGAWNCSGSPPSCTQDCPAELCDDGVDNDCDGLVDCADTDSCGASPACCTGEICGDGANNDCDDLEDYYDPECECNAEICDDGLDNDADGDPDCADGDCADGTSCNPYGSACSAGACVCPSGSVEADCTDGVDNDCDGNVDCDDLDCGPADGCARSEDCTNGLDDDLDGDVDCADVLDCPSGGVCGTNGEQCDSGGACACPSSGPESACGDGLDDDCDGDVDCSDADCDGSSCGDNGLTCAGGMCACPSGSSETSCTDGVDNDCDGDVDCADVDCDGVSCDANGRVCDLGTAMCACAGGASESSCIDGADNDCDGLVDCFDPDCDARTCGDDGLLCDAATTSCVCPGGTTEAACSDNDDNDCDGLIDCQDADCGCTPEDCTDGVDNDGDGLVDCNDPECGGQICGANGLTCSLMTCRCPGGDTESTCGDGVDNDCDGDTDCADVDCDGLSCGSNGEFCDSLMCSCPGGTVESACTDGLDNDCDGLVDCQDPDCGCSPEDCTNGVDDDIDGATDCADADCGGEICGADGLTCIAGTCDCPGGAVEADCSDGFDNDCDGDVDCVDTDCDGVQCSAFGEYCSVATGQCECPGPLAEATCDDGLDNDCDGSVDCADGDCNGAACDGNGRICSGLMCECPSGAATETFCTGSTDDDCDGLVDCADDDCDGLNCGSNGELCDFGTGMCECPGGSVESACGDGVDNDCDGDADCADTDCSGAAACCPAGCTCMDTCGAAGCTCNGGCPCTYECAGGGDDCNVTCSSTASCNITGDTVGNANFTCDGATCVADVSNATSVFADCDAGGSDCEVTCTDVSTCEMECGGSSAGCLLQCTNVGTCQFTSCPGGVMSCGGGVIVCQRGCP